MTRNLYGESNSWIIGFHGRGIKELKESMKQIFEYDNNYKELEGI